MKLVEEIPLPNRLTMRVWDGSQTIASDTTKVALRITVPVTVMKEYFRDPGQFERVVAVFGPEIPYEYTKERTFVSTPHSGEIFTGLLEDFKSRLASLSVQGRIPRPIRFIEAEGDIAAPAQVPACPAGKGFRRSPNIERRESMKRKVCVVGAGFVGYHDRPEDR